MKKWWHLAVKKHHILRRDTGYVKTQWIVTCSCYAKWLAPKEF